MASEVGLDEDEFRLLTWTHPEFSRITIEPESLQRHCPLDNGHPRQQPAADPVSHLGAFESLPLEILRSIFTILDLQSLTHFRAVSWRARSIMDNLPTYKALVQNSPNAVRALLSTHMATHFSAPDIFDALCAQACAGCGEFGPFLDMLTAQRYCFTCVAYADDLLLITPSTARKEFGLSLKTMATVRTLLSIPGGYGEGEKMFRKRISLVRKVSASAVSHIQKHGSSYLRSEPDAIAQTPPPRSPQPHSLRVLRTIDRYRFMAMLRIPFLDRATGLLDWGVSCQTCCLGPRAQIFGYCDWNTVYSTPGYMEHFQKCEISQRAIKERASQKMADPTFLRYLNVFRFGCIYSS